jgi:hypothetical protein
MRSVRPARSEVVVVFVLFVRVAALLALELLRSTHAHRPHQRGRAKEAGTRAPAARRWDAAAMVTEIFVSVLVFSEKSASSDLSRSSVTFSLSPPWRAFWTAQSEHRDPGSAGRRTIRLTKVVADLPRGVRAHQLQPRDCARGQGSGRHTQPAQPSARSRRSFAAGSRICCRMRARCSSWALRVHQRAAAVAVVRDRRTHSACFCSFSCCGPRARIQRPPPRAEPHLLLHPR